MRFNQHTVCPAKSSSARRSQGSPVGVGPGKSAGVVLRSRYRGVAGASERLAAEEKAGSQIMRRIELWTESFSSI